MIAIHKYDSNIVTQYGNWLRTFNWDLFGTLTFDPGRQSHSELSRITLLDVYYHELERQYRRHVRCFWAEDKRWSGCGLPAIAPHFHVLLACDRNPLIPDFPTVLWNNLAGHAEIRTYDCSRGAAFYCAKLIPSPDAHYGFKGFDSSRPDGPFYPGSQAHLAVKSR